MEEAAYAPGQIVAGKYRLERELGAGGMGVVYRAVDMSLERTVAIKFVHARLARVKDLAVQRLRREAQAVARLQNEHVAKVYEVVEQEEGMPFLVMEYLEGSDLADLVEEQGPLPYPRAVDLVLQACEALAEAHVEGLVHRDLKPSNLFLHRRRDGSESVKVLDFGIVKALGDAKETLTGASEVIGSIPFMAPEQLTASSYVTARSDIWSVGALFFSLVTGRLAFHGTSQHEIAREVARGEPLRLRDVRPDIPQGVSAAISACMTRDPAQRFANLAELSTALAPHGSEEAYRSHARIVHLWAHDGPVSECASTLAPDMLTAQHYPQASSLHASSAQASWALASQHQRSTAQSPHQQPLHPVVPGVPHAHYAPQHPAPSTLASVPEAQRGLLAPHLHPTTSAAVVHPTVAPPTPAKGRGALIAVLLSLLVGGVAVGAFVLGRIVDDGSLTVLGDDAKGSTGKPSNGRRKAKLRHVDTARIEEAIEDAGYHARDVTFTSSMVSIVPYKGNIPMGIVQFYKATDSVSATVYYDEMVDAETATVARDGLRILVVQLDDDMGDELLIFNAIVEK